MMRIAIDVDSITTGGKVVHIEIGGNVIHIPTDRYIGYMDTQKVKQLCRIKQSLIDSGTDVVIEDVALLQKLIDIEWQTVYLNFKRGVYEVM